MRINRRTWDHQITGMLLGAAAPLAGVFVFYFVQSAEMHGITVAEYQVMLGDKRILSMILSWSLLANLAVFAIFNRLDLLRSAQGVVFSTLLYGMLIIYLKMF
jgi:hypothetical protein